MANVDAYIEKKDEGYSSRIDDGKAQFGIEGRRIAGMKTAEQSKSYLGISQRNLMINGDFSIWQRNINGNAATYTAGQFSADRWYHSGGNTTGGADGFGIQHTSTNNDPYFLYRLEDPGHEWAGKDFVCSFYIKTNDGSNQLQYLTIDNINYYHREPMNDGDGKQLYEIESDIPNYKRYYVRGRFNATYSAGNINYHRFVFEMMAYAGCVTTLAYVQVELGNTPTPFQKRTYGEELALCQRYYQIHRGGFFGRFISSSDYSFSQWSPIVSMVGDNQNSISIIERTDLTGFSRVAYANGTSYVMGAGTYAWNTSTPYSDAPYSGMIFHGIGSTIPEGTIAYAPNLTLAFDAEF